MSSGWRVAVVGIVFVGMFAALTLRLWSIQVTSAVEYDEQAAVQQVRIVETPAPRGDIRDRKGELLAGTRTSLAVVVDRALVPTFAEEDLTQRLSAFLGIPASQLQHLLDDANSGARITIASDLTDDQALFVVEHREDFPGVTIVPQPVRTYPLGELAAHVIGYIGRPDSEDLKKPSIASTDVLGKAGVERQYDAELRGEPGQIKYRVDSRRNVLGTIAELQPTAGATLILELDSTIQQHLEDSLESGLALSRQIEDPGCVPNEDNPGCPIRAVGVVVDPRNGAILAMASVPSFDPIIFIDGLSQAEWAQLSQSAVFNNFAIQGSYAPASTFKTVAYFAALEEGIYPEPASEDTHDANYFCDGQLEFQFTDGSQQVYHDWTSDGHGNVDLREALQASCDLYYWEIALRVWNGRNDEVNPIDESLLQEWARLFGFGEKTEIDLPFEKAGLIPDSEWFYRTQQRTPGRVRDGPWVGGDLMNTVIGQGEVLVTPLQLANAYAAMVNGGVVWKPRVVREIVDVNGQPLVENPREILRTIDISESTVRRFREDLRLVVNGPRGTARTAFSDFGDGKTRVGGKTGTAEVIQGRGGEPDVDTAWFVGVAPLNVGAEPQYVVAVVIERGGSGGRVAAPTAKQVLQYLLLGEDGVTPIIEGERTD